MGVSLCTAQCSVCGGKRLAFLYDCGGFRIATCLECGSGFVDELPSPERIEQEYGEDFFGVNAKFSTEAVSPESETNCRSHWELVTRFLPKGALLDIGCATGDFLLTAPSGDWQLSGVEFSPYASNLARKRTRLPVLQGGIEQATRVVVSHSLDAITLWDVIEHVPDPRACLRTCRGLLRDDGFLFLTTGRFDSLSARLMGRRWHLMIPPRHLFFFSLRGIRLLLESCGFRWLGMSYEGRSVPRDFIVEKLGRKYGIRLPLAVQRLLPERLRVNLHDIMSVAASCGQMPEREE